MMNQRGMSEVSWARAILARAFVRTSAKAVAAMVLLIAVGCDSVKTAPRVTVSRPTPAPTPRPRPIRTVAPAPLPPPPPLRRVSHSFAVGYSRQGTPLTLHVFGSGRDNVLIFGGIHGDEPTSATLARDLTAHLRAHPEIADGHTIAILTDANPDGLARRSRFNSRGVDLNRNFPAKNWRRAGVKHGVKPVSEPETAAIIRAIEAIRPNRIISIHSAGRGRHCNNYDGPARGLAATMGRYNRYPVKASMGYPTPGSFGSWSGVDRKVPTITLELPRDLNGPACWRENREALLAFIRAGGTHIAK